MRIPVMTFNIQHGLDFKRREKEPVLSPGGASGPKPRPKPEDPSLIDLSLTAKAIRECGAAIIGLNEVRDESDDPCYLPQTRLIAEGAGCPYYFFGKAIDFFGRGPYGNAIISKYPILSAETVPIPDPAVKDEPVYYETRCVIRAKLQLPADPGGDPVILTVLVTHMGLARSEAKNAVETVLSLVEEGKPTLLMGDFNLSLDSPILSPLREVFRDAGELLSPNACLSFPSDEPTSKIDYIMTAGPVEILKAEIPAIVASDHRPHTALLAL